MKALKFSMGCLIGVLAMHTVFCIGQSNAPWLKIFTMKENGKPERVIIHSMREPIVSEIGQGNQWEIVFFP